MSCVVQLLFSFLRARQRSRSLQQERKVQNKQTEQRIRVGEVSFFVFAYLSSLSRLLFSFSGFQFGVNPELFPGHGFVGFLPQLASEVNPPLLFPIIQFWLCFSFFQHRSIVWFPNLCAVEANHKRFNIKVRVLKLMCYWGVYSTLQNTGLIFGWVLQQFEVPKFINLIHCFWFCNCVIGWSFFLESVITLSCVLFITLCFVITLKIIFLFHNSNGFQLYFVAFRLFKRTSDFVSSRSRLVAYQN